MIDALRLRGIDRTHVAAVAFVALAIVATLSVIGNRRIAAATIGEATPLLIVAAFAGAALVVRYSNAAVTVLVAIVYLNLSEALVRYHNFPSVLQLIVVGVTFAAWLKRDTSKVREVVVQPLTVALAAYLLLTFASTAWALDLDVADDGFGNTLKAFILFSVTTFLMHDRRRLVQGIAALLAAAFLIGILVAGQFVTGDYDHQFGGLARVKNAHIYGDVFEPRAAGPVGDPNSFAQVLLLVAPLTILLPFAVKTHGARAAIVASAVAVNLALALTYSRGAMVSFAVMTLLMLAALHVRWRFTVATVAALLVLFLLLPAGLTQRVVTIEQILPGGAEVLHRDSSFEERKLLMRVAARIFEDFPVKGVGIANYTAHYDAYVSEIGSDAPLYEEPSALHYPHNLYLQIGAETGVIGLALFLAVIVSCWRALGEARRSFGDSDRTLAFVATALQIALVGFLVSSLFLHMTIVRYVFLVFAFAASIQRLARKSGAEARDSRHTFAAATLDAPPPPGLP